VIDDFSCENIFRETVLKELEFIEVKRNKVLGTNQCYAVITCQHYLSEAHPVFCHMNASWCLLLVTVLALSGNFVG
jgi:hypothetical protein